MHIIIVLMIMNELICALFYILVTVLFPVAIPPVTATKNIFNRFRFNQLTSVKCIFDLKVLETIFTIDLQVKKI